MLCNKLKINDSKTEFLLLASKTSLAKLQQLNLKIKVGSEEITPSSKARNLGALFDSEMSMQDQVTSVTRASYFHLRRIKKIKHHLDQDSCAKLVNACVTSRLDYHNALLTSCPSKTLHRLQIVQNNAARVLSGVKQRQHITPVLRDLHWLPIESRIQFKVLVFIHQALHNAKSPLYIKDAISVYHPRRELRSSSDNFMLVIPRCNRLRGMSSINVLGPKLWNELPSSMRQCDSKAAFKSQLKTYLFKKVFKL